jgi:hypothetical protein
MEFDHAFRLVDSQEAAEDAVGRLGMTETYRRKHPGQGTANICCCFDNAFIEFLWVENPAEASREPTLRLGMIERRMPGNCPFGISWRGDAGSKSPAKWRYMPTYLPPGMGIDVLDGRSNHVLPLMFQSPGTAAPIDWPEEKRRGLQHQNGFGRILAISLAVPERVVEHEHLAWLNQNGLARVLRDPDDQFSLTLAIENRNNKRVTNMRLPSCSTTHSLKSE